VCARILPQNRYDLQQRTVESIARDRLTFQRGETQHACCRSAAPLDEVMEEFVVECRVRPAEARKKVQAVLDVAAARLGAPVQREALDQIVVKLARICAGDPACSDHWRELAGYAWLAGQRRHSK